jgi:NADP-dependent 3-hydroxy acid dehydrogenase YdfG
MFQKVFNTYGRIDALCANAGIVDRSSIFIFEHRGSDKIPSKPDLLCTDVDYKGVVYGTQLAIHFMRKNKTPGGKIVATASVAAIVPHETYPEYDGAKAAVVNFVRGTARVLKSVRSSMGMSECSNSWCAEREHLDQCSMPGHCAYQHHPSRDDRCSVPGGSYPTVNDCSRI